MKSQRMSGTKINFAIEKLRINELTICGRHNAAKKTYSSEEEEEIVRNNSKKNHRVESRRFEVSNHISMVMTWSDPPSNTSRFT